VARRTKRSESFRFRVMYFFFRILFRTLTGVTVRNGNYAAYRGWLARRMLRHPYFDLCYSSTLVSLDLPVTAVPIARGTRYSGHSRMNLFRLLMHGIRMLTPFTDRIAIRALTAFTAIFGIGILLSLAVVGTKLFSSAAIPGWATATLLGILVLSFNAVGTSVVLFAVFSHSRGVSLAGLEESYDGRVGRTSSSSS
jgi:polyisoprenyl-phosphate glycosyltransferase